MPSSVRSTSSSADRRRVSQSLNRVALLGGLAGIEDTRLPPFRVESPMTMMQDELRTIYGAPSLESLSSIDAVVTQMDDPRAPPHAPPLTEPESGRRSRRGSLALSDSVRSVQSTASKVSGRSRSRARNQALAQQHGIQVSSERVLDGDGGSVVSRPPLSHPEILMPGHMRARSETAIDAGSSTEWKRQIMALKGGQSRKSLAMPEPDWVKDTVKGSRFAISSRSDVPAPPSSRRFSAMPFRRAQTEEGKDTAVVDYGGRSRRSSTTTVTQDSFLDNSEKVKTPTSRRESRRDSSMGTAAAAYPGGGEAQTVRSTARNSRLPPPPPRLGLAVEKEKEKRIVQARGVTFEMMDLDQGRVRTEPSRPPRSFRPLSVAIPPSERSTSSFSVRSVTRSPTVSVSPSDFSSSAASPSRISESSPRPSTRSSATSAPRSRSPSPARGSFNPHEKSMLARVERFSDAFARKSYQIKQSMGLEQKEFKVINRPQPTSHASVVPTSRRASQPPLDAPTPISPAALSMATFARSPPPLAQKAPATAPLRGPSLSLQIPKHDKSPPIRVFRVRLPHDSSDSFAHRVAAVGTAPGLDETPQKIFVPTLQPPSYHRRYSRHHRATRPPQEERFPRNETPPSFAADLKRVDSLHMGEPKASASKDVDFFSSWTQRQPQDGATAEYARNPQDRPRVIDVKPQATTATIKPEGEEEEPKTETQVDDRRLLPSQRQRQWTIYDRIARQEEIYARRKRQPDDGPWYGIAPSPEVPRTPRLRKTPNIDFSILRDTNQDEAVYD